MPNEIKNLITKGLKGGLRASQDNASASAKGKRIAENTATVTMWTLSGVVIAACSGSREILFDDGSGKGGGLGAASVRVLDGNIKGAGVFFDLDGDGVVSDAEKDAQRNSDGSPKYVTDTSGMARVPSRFATTFFVADVQGATDVATGELLEGSFNSLPEGRIATPLTDLMWQWLQANTNGTAQEALDAILGVTGSANPAIVMVEDVLNPLFYEVPATPKTDPVRPGANATQAEIDAYKNAVISRAAVVLTEIKEQGTTGVTTIINLAKPFVDGTANNENSGLKSSVDGRYDQADLIAGGKPVTAPQVNVPINEDSATGLKSEWFGFLDPSGNASTAPASSFMGILINRSATNGATLNYDGAVLRFDHAGNVVLGSRPETGWSFIAVENLGNLTITPAANSTTTTAIEYYVFDGEAWSSKATMTFDVRDVNDAPTDIALSASAVVPNQTDVGTFSTTDIDLGNVLSPLESAETHSYSLGRAGDESYFKIEGNKLILRDNANRKAQGDTYSVEVISTDSGGARFTKTFTLTEGGVYVQVSGSSANRFSGYEDSEGNGLLNENVGASTVIGTVGSVVQGVTVSLAANSATNDNSEFTLSGGTLTFRGSGSVNSGNYETGDTKTIEFTVTPSSGPATTETYVIKLRNLDDNAPVFANTTATATVAEDAGAGVLVHTARATDADNDAITYTIESGNGANLFAINGTTGAVTVRANDSLDFDTGATSYTLVIRATSGTNNRTHDQTLTITLSDVDEAPTDITLPGVLLSGSNASRDVGTLQVTDPDAGDSHTFSFEPDPVAGTLNDNALFDLNETTGAVSLKSTVATRKAPGDTYTIRVKATDTDDASLSFTKDITVLVGGVYLREANSSTNLFSGHEDSNGQGLLNENADASTTAITIGKVGSVAPGVTSITLDGSKNDNDEFEIIGADTITVTTGQKGGVGTASDSDSAKTGGYHVTGSASLGNYNQTTFVVYPDGASSITVTSNITGVARGTPAVLYAVKGAGQSSWSLKTYASGASVSEAEYYKIGDINANGVINYVGTDIAASGTFEHATAETGNLNYKGSDSGNFEGRDTKTIALQVTAGGTTTTETYQIKLKDVDEKPVFTSGTTGTIAENAGDGAVVAGYRAQATDPDSGTGRIDYTVNGGTGEALFTVNQTTGVVTLNRKGSIDYDAGPRSYTLNIEASSITGNNSFKVETQTVTISVTNVNEAPTGVALSATAAVPNTQVVGTLSVVGDPDVGDTTHTITLSGRSSDGSGTTFDNALFEVHGGNTLRFKSGVTRKSPGQTYNVEVEVVDNNPNLAAVRQVLTFVEGGTYIRGSGTTRFYSGYEDSNAQGLLDENADASTTPITLGVLDNAVAGSEVGFDTRSNAPTNDNDDFALGTVSRVAVKEGEKVNQGATADSSSNLSGSYIVRGASSVTAGALEVFSVYVDGQAAITVSGTMGTDLSAGAALYAVRQTDGSWALNSYASTGTPVSSETYYKIGDVASNGTVTYVGTEQTLIGGTFNAGEVYTVYEGEKGGQGSTDDHNNTGIYHVKGADKITNFTDSYSFYFYPGNTEVARTAAVLNPNNVRLDNLAGATLWFEDVAANVTIRPSGFNPTAARIRVYVKIGTLLADGTIDYVGDDIAPTGFDHVSDIGGDTVIGLTQGQGFGNGTASDSDSANTDTYYIKGLTGLGNYRNATFTVYVDGAAPIVVNRDILGLSHGVAGDLYLTKGSADTTWGITAVRAGQTPSAAEYYKIGSVSTGGNITYVGTHRTTGTFTHKDPATLPREVVILASGEKAAQGDRSDSSDHFGAYYVKGKGAFTQNDISAAQTFIIYPDGAAAITVTGAIAGLVFGTQADIYAQKVSTGNWTLVANPSSYSPSVKWFKVANMASDGTLDYYDTDVTAGFFEHAFDALNPNPTLIYNGDDAGDYESNETKTVAVKITKDGNTTYETYQIKLKDVDEDPTFASATATGTIAENSQSGTAVSGYRAQATDVDSGTNIDYSIEGGTGSGLFAIDQKTGVVTLSSGSLNFESTNKSYTLVIRATTTTGNNPAKTVDQTLTISVTDVNEAPTALTLSGGARVPGVLDVGTVSVSGTNDPDNYDGITDTTHTIRMEANVTGTNNNLFTFDASTGQLSLKDESDALATGESYRLQFKVADPGTPNLPEETIILTFVEGGLYLRSTTVSGNLYTGHTDSNGQGLLAENADASSTAIDLGVLKSHTAGATFALATSSDSGQPLHDNAEFTLTGGNTTVTVGSGKKAGVGTSANQKGEGTYHVVGTSDVAASSTEHSFTLYIDGEASTITARGRRATVNDIEAYAVQATEGGSWSAAFYRSGQGPASTVHNWYKIGTSASGSNVMNYVGTDINAGGTFTHDEGKTLTYNGSDSGDFEASESKTVNVKVTVSGTSTFETYKVNLSDVDEKPVFTSLATASVSEGAVAPDPSQSIAGTVLYTAQAADPDSARGAIRYSLATTNSAAILAMFQIDSASGALRLKQQQSLDYDVAANRSHTIVIEAAATNTSSGSTELKATHTLTLNVTNVNEAPTGIVVSNSAAVPGNNVIGTLSTEGDPDDSTGVTDVFVVTGNTSSSLHNSRFEVVNNDTLQFKAGATRLSPGEVYSVEITVTNPGLPSSETLTRTITFVEGGIRVTPIGSSTPIYSGHSDGVLAENADGSGTPIVLGKLSNADTTAGALSLSSPTPTVLPDYIVVGRGQKGTTFTPSGGVKQSYVGPDDLTSANFNASQTFDLYIDGEVKITASGVISNLTSSNFNDGNQHIYAVETVSSGTSTWSLVGHGNATYTDSNANRVILLGKVATSGAILYTGSESNAPSGDLGDVLYGDFTSQDSGGGNLQSIVSHKTPAHLEAKSQFRLIPTETIGVNGGEKAGQGTASDHSGTGTYHVKGQAAVTSSNYNSVSFTIYPDGAAAFTTTSGISGTQFGTAATLYAVQAGSNWVLQASSTRPTETHYKIGDIATDGTIDYVGTDITPTTITRPSTRISYSITPGAGEKGTVKSKVDVNLPASVVGPERIAFDSSVKPAFEYITGRENFIFLGQKNLPLVVRTDTNSVSDFSNGADLYIVGYSFGKTRLAAFDVGRTPGSGEQHVYVGRVYGEPDADGTYAIDYAGVDILPATFEHRTDRTGNLEFIGSDSGDADGRNPDSTTLTFNKAVAPVTSTVQFTGTKNVDASGNYYSPAFFHYNGLVTTVDTTDNTIDVAAGRIYVPTETDGTFKEYAISAITALSIASVAPTGSGLGRTSYVVATINTDGTVTVTVESGRPREANEFLLATIDYRVTRDASDNILTRTITTSANTQGGTGVTNESVTIEGTPATFTTETYKVNLSDVDDNAPVFGSSTATRTIAEDTAIGTAIYTAQATDADRDDIFQYYFQVAGGTAAVAQVNGFTIALTSGVITYTGETALDYDTPGTRTITLTVLAYSGPTGSLRTTPAEQTLTINLTDVAEVPTEMSLPGSLLPGNNASSVVGTITFVDEDATNTYTYEKVNDATGQPLDNALFDISSSGQVTFNGSTRKAGGETYMIRVKATDTAAGKSITETFTITVGGVYLLEPGDTAASDRRYSNYSDGVLEENADGSTTAVDIGRLGDITAGSKSVTFALRPTASRNDNGDFNIVASTGMLQYTGSDSGDFEDTADTSRTAEIEVSIHTLTTTTFSGQKNAMGDVTAAGTNITFTGKLFSYNGGNISTSGGNRSVSAGTIFVESGTASDGVTKLYEAVSFSSFSFSGPGYVKVTVTESGGVKSAALSSSFSESTEDNEYIIAYARTGNTIQQNRSGTAVTNDTINTGETSERRNVDYVVNLKNVDEAPDFTPSGRSTAIIAESDTSWSMTINAEAEDPEGNAVTYSVDPNGKFEYNASTDTLSLKSGETLDFDSLVDGKMTVELVATSQTPGSGAKRSTHFIDVTVTPTNRAPEYINLNSSNSDWVVLGADSSSLAVGVLSVYDPDAPTNSLTGYTFAQASGTNDNSYFNAISNTNSLSLDVSSNRKNVGETYKLEFTVTDANGNGATSSTQTLILVEGGTGANAAGLYIEDGSNNRFSGYATSKNSSNNLPVGLLRENLDGSTTPVYINKLKHTDTSVTLALAADTATNDNSEFTLNTGVDTITIGSNQAASRETDTNRSDRLHTDQNRAYYVLGPNATSINSTDTYTFTVYPDNAGSITFTGTIENQGGSFTGSGSLFMRYNVRDMAKGWHVQLFGENSRPDQQANDYYRIGEVRNGTFDLKGSDVTGSTFGHTNNKKGDLHYIGSNSGNYDSTPDAYKKIDVSVTSGSTTTTQSYVLRLRDENAAPVITYTAPTDTTVSADLNDDSVFGFHSSVVITDQDRGDNAKNVRLYYKTGDGNAPSNAPTDTDRGDNQINISASADTTLEITGKYGDWTITRTTLGEIRWNYTINTQDSDTMGIAFGDTKYDFLSLRAYDASANDVASNIINISVSVNGATPARLAGTTSGDDTLTSSTAAHLISGQQGNDTINSGSGADIIAGGTGNDTINLPNTLNLSGETTPITTDGVKQTIYYRWDSNSSNQSKATDGGDTINNFKRGEDRLVLVDINSNPVETISEWTTAGRARMTVEFLSSDSTSRNTTVTGVKFIFGVDASNGTSNEANRTLTVNFDQSSTLDISNFAFFRNSGYDSTTTPNLTLGTGGYDDLIFWMFSGNTTPASFPANYSATEDYLSFIDDSEIPSGLDIL